MATSKKWHPLVLKPPFVKEMNDGLDQLQTGIDTINDILTVVKQLLEIAKLVSAIVAGNPLEQILKQILDEIERILEALLEKTAIYSIIIPIHKQSFGLGKEPDFTNISGTNSLKETNTFTGALPSTKM